ncbi:MAG: WD40 repeat domain-containing protein [Flavobacteriales bacterium]
MFRTSFFAAALAASLLPQLLSAQQVQWLTVAPNSFNLNPSLPTDVLCARDPDHVYVAGLDSATILYGNDILGRNSLSRLNANGDPVWTVVLNDSVKVESITSNAAGTVVIGGRYFGHLVIDGDPTVAVPPFHTGMGSFICAFDADGLLLWQHDKSGGQIDDVSVASLAFDPQGQLWVALSTFFGSKLVRLNNDGLPVITRLLLETKTIGNICFDPSGGMYVSGSASVPSVSINGTTFPVVEQYNFFLARMNAAGDAQWLHIAHDVTFQRPRVVADGEDHAYLLGSQLDSVSWGNVHFNAPEWNTSFFLTRLDSSGVFEWGVEPPQAGIIGRFGIGQGMGLGVDDDGNAYVLGNVSGSVDWGNGMVSNTGGLQTEQVSLLSFDNAGIARSHIEGGSAVSLDVVHDLAVTHDGICHLVATTGDPFTFGPFTVDPMAVRGSVVARVDPALGTGIGLIAEAEAGLVACPSLFSTSFHLVSGGALSDAAVAVRIIDASGRTVEEAAGLGNELGLRLSPGTYTVLVQRGAQVMRTRVVKE